MQSWQLVYLLPGLWLAALAACLGWSLRRWFDPVPARVWITYGAVTCILLGSALFGGKTLLPVDNLRSNVPFRHLEPTEPSGNRLQSDLILQIGPSWNQVRSALLAGKLPFRDPHVGAGVSLLGDPQAQVFQPLKWLSLPFDLQAEGAVTAGLRLLLAFVFGFLFMDRVGLASGAALVGATAYSLGGFLVLWLGWPLANSSAFLPTVLYALLRFREEGRKRDTVLLLAAIFGLINGGHPETVLYVGVFAAIFLVSLVKNSAKGDRIRFLLRVALVGGVSACLSAPILVPSLLQVQDSYRGFQVAVRTAHESDRGLDQVLEELPGWAPAAGRRWVGLVAPDAQGNSRYGEYWGPGNTIRDSSGFAGASVLLLAALSLFRGRKTSHYRLCLGTSLVVLLAVLSPPGFSLALSKVPLVGMSASSGHRVTVLLPWCLAFMAASGVSTLASSRPRFAPVVGISIVVLGLLAWLYFGMGTPEMSTALDSRRLLAAGVQIAAVVATAIWAITAKRRSLAKELMVGVVALELLVIFKPANPALPRLLDRAPPASIAFLQDNLEGQRFMSLDLALRPNLGSLFGINDVAFYNPIAPYQIYLLTFPLGPYQSNLQRHEGVGSPLLDFLGVRYVLAAPRRELPAENRLVFRDKTGWIYERPTAFPRLRLANALPLENESALWWLAQDPQVSRSRLLGRITSLNDGAIAWMSRSNDLFDRVYVDQRNLPLAESDSLTNPHESVRILTETSNRLEAQVASPGGKLLVSSLIQDGGWRLKVDGKPYPTLRVNGPFVGAKVPAGNHQIVFTYRPPGFLLGSALALLGVLAGIVLLELPRFRGQLRLWILSV